MRPELSELRVALYGSGGAPYHHDGLVALWGGDPIPLRADAIRKGALDGFDTIVFDAIVFPGGGMRAMAGMLDPLGVEGAAAIRRWVEGGGMYLGSCAGSFLPAAVGDGYWEAHPEARELHMVGAPLANGGDSEFESLTSPGVGTLDVELTDPQHWLAAGLPDRFRLVHYNGPLFDLGALRLTAAHGDGALAAPAGAARPVAAGARFTPSEAFLGPEPAPGESLFDSCVARGAHNAITAPYGAGTVVLFGSHPEFGFDAIQLGWGEGATLIANALAHQAARKRRGEPTGDIGARPAPAAATTSTADLAALLVDAADRLDALAAHFTTLRAADTGAWLAPGNAASFLGRDPATLWRDALDRAAEVAPAAGRQLREVAASDADLVPLRRWIDDPPQPDQDYGFMGLTQLIATAETMTATAERLLPDEPTPLAHAYDAIDSNPYQQLVGSYLSAVGLTSCIALTAALLAVRGGLEPDRLAAHLLADRALVEV
jgi:hypothetical protein